MSKFKSVLAHPVTKEVGRFAAYTTVTFVGKWAIGKAVAAYSARKQEKAFAQQAQQAAPMHRPHDGVPQA